MRHDRRIAWFTWALFGMQLTAICYWCMLGEPQSAVRDVLAAVLAALTLGLADRAFARYLNEALSRDEAAYALGVNERLDRALGELRDTAHHEEELAREVAHEVEAELAKARQALAEARLEELDGHLRQGLDAARKTQAPPCDNLAVAAVLEAKARQCAEAGVGFSARVTLPEELGIPELDAASVFFNLIDNALHECQALDGDAPREVRVRARVEVGQLFVEVENPCRAHADVAREGRRRRLESEGAHGWGTEIVRGIVQERGGIVEFVEEDGTFHARALIPVEGATA